jgi:hypothetical protein
MWLYLRMRAHRGFGGSAAHAARVAGAGLIAAGALIVFGGVPSSATPAAAPLVLASGWTYTDLGTLAGTASSDGLDINDAGVVVGSSGSQAARWVNGVAEGLGAPSVRNTATAINASGRIVGAGSPNDGTSTAYEFRPGQSPIALGDGRAEDINASGVVVGSGTLPGTGIVARRYLPSFQELNPAGAITSTADGVDDEGNLYGTYVGSDFTTHGVVFDGGSGTPIASDGRTILPQGVSPGGVVAGRLLVTPSSASPVRVDDGVVTPLPDVPGGWSPNDVSDDGLVVGGSELFAYRSSEGYLSQGGVTTAVSDWLPAGFGWRIASLNGVNAHRQVVGTAIDCPLNSSGACTTHAIRLDPPGFGATTSSTSTTSSPTSSSSTSSTTSTSLAAASSSTTVSTTSTTTSAGSLPRTGGGWPSSMPGIGVVFVGIGMIGLGSKQLRLGRPPA